MAASLIIDMRCLQDPNYADRGIGGHARAIVSRAPSPFIGIIDPKLPPLPDDIARLAVQLLPGDSLPDFSPGTVFLNPSPMGPDQNFIARLLLDRQIVKAACVHDFIPWDDPVTYLAKAVAKLDYYASLVWLRCYDVFFPVSEDTGARLKNLYGPVRTHVTGAALPGWAEHNLPAPQRHILMVGGEDARKNPEVMIAAHGTSETLRQIPLVITGNYSVPAIARLQALGPAEFPGTVSEAALKKAYAEAFCVVAPSRAEGFSLPVIEAMAAGVPAIVSDIPAHRALVPDEAARFAPDNAPQLAAILEDIVTSETRRDRLIAAQRNGWRPFTGDAIASKIWAEIQAEQSRRGKLAA